MSVRLQPDKTPVRLKPDLRETMMLPCCCSHLERPRSRRQWLAQLGAGFGTLAWSAMLAEESSAADPLAPRPPHLPAKAKRVIFLCM